MATSTISSIIILKKYSTDPQEKVFIDMSILPKKINDLPSNISKNIGNTFVFYSADPTMESLKKLIEDGVSPNLIGLLGDTALIKASKEGFLNTVNYLIEKGANLNLRNDEGKTALIVSIENGFPDVAELLLISGANPRLPNNKQRFHAGHFLLRNLHSSSRSKFKDKTESMLKMMFANGLPINQSDGEGRSMLSYSIDMDIPLSVTEFIIKSGSDISHMSLIGYEPIHYAALNGRPEFIDLLLSNGADINALSSRGNTPIYLAQKTEAIKTILKYNPTLDMHNDIGDTPLTFHLRDCYYEGDRLKNIGLLVVSGADIDFCSADNMTPQLISSEKEDHFAIFQLFKSTKARMAVESLLSAQSMSIAKTHSKTF